MGDLIQLDDHRPHVLIEGARFGSKVHAVPLSVVIAWLKGQQAIEFGDTEIILREYVASMLVDEDAITEADVTRYAKLFRSRQRRASSRAARRDAPRAR